MEFDIAKEKGGQWFCHQDGQVVPGSHGDKKHAIKYAAKLNGMTTKEFLKERKKMRMDLKCSDLATHFLLQLV